MKRIFILTILFFGLNNLGFSQMWNGVDTLFGNEWIQYDQQYYKMLVAEDGVYRVNKSTLEDAGVPLNNIDGTEFQVLYMGQEVPVFTSSEGSFDDQDYIEFYGKKNRSELDYHLFANPEEDMMNPRYSLYTDTSAYFLTWNTDNSADRYTDTNNDLTNLPVKETSYLEELWMDFSDRHSKEYGNQTVRNSYFETAEGFATQYKKTQSEELNPTNPDLESGISANLYVRYATDFGGGTNSGNGVHNQTIKINGEQVAVDETFRFNVIEHDFPIANAALEDPIEISFEGSVSNQDKQAIANLKLTYPRLFNFENEALKYFKIGNSTGVKYLEIEDFDNSGEIVLYDLTNKIRIIPTEEGGVLKISLPPSATERELVLVSTAGIKSIANISSVNFVNYLNHESDYFIVTHPKLNQPDNQGVNQITEYVDYRSSSEGGEFSPLVIDINQLYDQFSYGIMRHPISIRNFAQKLRKEENLPEYFYLIGKGREYQTYRKAADIANVDDLPLLVPTFGYPASDRMLLSDNLKATPVTAIGRLPVSTTEDLRIYLDKVKEFEGNVNNASTLEDRAWMKRIIHLGGGGVLSEQTIIRNHLIAMENTIENSIFGADVRPFYRTNTNAVEVSTNEQIFENINNGVSILSFFGHAGANSFDYNIDNFDNFNNKGKYPIMFAMGCSIGNIHTSFKAVGERFVFGHEDKGMIAFVASSSFGFISSLRVQMDKTYDLMGNEMYGESIGNIMREVTRLNDTPNNILTQQNTLNGDPALRFNPFEGPDVLVDAASVKFNPNNIHTDLNSFDFSFDVVNIGKGLEDSITIKIEQQLPNNQIETPLVTRVKTPLNRTTLTYSMPIYGKPSVGLNNMMVTVDTQNELAESPAPAAEMNNELRSSLGELGIPFFIQDNGIETAFPPEFAIVNEQTVTLIASTSNALAPERKYIMQFDTTENFNSSFLQQQESTQIGGLFKWQPSVTLENEQVYYWRVSPDSLSELSGFVWDESSFVYLTEYEEGWNQSDFGQWERNNFEDIMLSESGDSFQFILDLVDISIKNKVWEALDKPLFTVLGNAIASPWPWTIDAGVQMIVINPVDFGWLTPVNGSPLYGSASVGTDPWVFSTSTMEERNNLIDFLENGIPDNYYVVFYTIQKNYDAVLNVEYWAGDSTLQMGKNLYNVLEGFGASKIRELEEKGSVPYAFVFQKGQNVLDEAIANDISSLATVNVAIPRLFKEGSFYSTLIGPAKSWDNLYWDIVGENINDNDSFNISLSGINVELNIDTVLFDKIEENEFSLTNINANDFPFLRLNFYAKDEVERSVVNLEYWRITHQGIPELAVNPASEFEFYRDTLQEGEYFKVRYAIENISNHNADSLLIEYSIANDQNEISTQSDRVEPIEKFGGTVAEFSMDTRGMSNVQNILVEINANDDQEELTHINNFINGQFFVERDKRNPILDVTFDGMHIMDGDLVSPEPVIVVNLEDENKYLELADTALFRLSIQYPEEAEPRRISLESEAIVFYPAVLNEEGDKNEARIEYSPTLEVDGIYSLIVEAQDATGNESGDLRYRIGFEVINKNMISSILNYPNPFSTSTRFVYTLTGNNPPAFFKIQIMTVSGRIIREITQDEIGPLKTGTHTTEYAWDGTDEFGDKLANGIYLYRVTAQKNDGTEFEAIETGADKFIKKGFGKMVLIR